MTRALLAPIMDRMTPIQALAPEEVEKIAAGEVVERPVSVVKELVENSLDAGAQRISVAVEDGGKQLISVTDDGAGIPSAELPLAVKNFHTSKIRLCEDIYHQVSLGFRGEALAAISSISRLSITSRTASEEVGATLSVDGGKATAPKPATLNPGTIIEVRDLFFNTPVRKKFLRSRATEVSHIVRLMQNYVLAFSDVAFTLTSDSRILFASGGRGLSPDTLKQVFGADVAPELYAFTREYPPLGVSGLIAPPSAYRETRKQQFFFVNRRPVKNRVLYRAADDALREHLSSDRYPPLALFLDIPPEEVDVNIHPTKSEVSFMHQQQVYSAIVVALKDAVSEMGQPHDSPAAEGGLEVADVVLPPRSPVSDGRRTVPIYDMGEPLVGGTDATRTARLRGSLSVLGEDTVVSTTQELGLPSFLHPGGKYFASQIGAAYIVVVREGEVLLIDQHAAHERVLFERFWSALEGAGKVDRQKLLFPASLPLNTAERDAFAEKLPFLERLGFAVRLEDEAALVDEVPRFLLSRGDEDKVRALVAELAEAGFASALDDAAKELVSSVACKAAIKAGELLKPAELKVLVAETLALKDNATCPHGRPIVQRLAKDQLEKLFHRK